MSRRHFGVAAAALTLAITGGMAGCADTQGATTAQGSGSAVAAPATISTGAYSIEGRTYPFRWEGTPGEEPTDTEMNLYFVDGGEIPYVNMEEYLEFVGMLYGWDDNDVPSVQYSVEVDGESAMVTRADNGSTMGIDANVDVLSFDDYNLFTIAPSSATLVALSETAGMEGSGRDALLAPTTAAYDRAGQVVVMSLADYGIDLIVEDGVALMPLQTVNDVLVMKLYTQVVFNGEEVIAAGYGSDFLEEEYSAPTGEMSEELSTFNYCELRFFLDNFYGLKPEHNIENFATYLMETGLMQRMMGTDPQEFDLALAELTTLQLDDLHSGFLSPSYLSGYDLDVDDVPEGASNNASGEIDIVTRQARRQYYPDLGGNVFLYEEVGDTAIITFDEFKADKDDYQNEADLENPQDTIELIACAHQQITREGSPIKNVVIDLSCNGGGAADTAAYTIAFFRNTAQVALRDTLTGAQSVCSYVADINLDGEFNEDDYLPEGLHLYCLTSASSFSCGNLVPTAFKDAPNITMIGRTTGGGSCVVLPATTAIGSIFQISGPTQIGIIKNGSFYNADTGIEPDYVISDWNTFYDRQALVEFIHGLV